MEYVRKNQKFRMGKKTLLLLVLLLTVSNVGCSLAKKEAAVPEKDRLIGAFISREPIEKTYATVEWVPAGKVPAHPFNMSFDGIKGVFLYFFEDQISEDESSFIWPVGRGMNVNDNFIEEEGKRIVEVTGTAYFMPRVGEDINEFYLNPIYQTADREVYVVKGNSISIGPGMNSPGASCSLKYEEEERRTLIDKTQIDKTTIEVTLYVAYEPVSIQLYQMSSDDKVVKKETYHPGEQGMDLYMETETEYVLLETEQRLPTGETRMYREIYNWDGNNTVEIPDHDGKEVSYKMTELESFYSLDDGFLQKDYGWLLWD